MFYAGTPFAHEIDFSTGLPTGAVVYSLLGNDGLPVTGYNAISVTPAVGAVSLLIVIPGTVNTVATPLFETRTLTWSYTTANGVVSDRVRYRVERDIIFPVTADGVRNKLGVDPHEIPDQDIDLLSAYAELAAMFEEDAFLPYQSSGDRNSLLIANAIEAMAGLSLIPSLQLAVARKESSGTNTYERFAGADWEALRSSLISYLSPLNDLLVPLVDLTDYRIVFTTVVRPDIITGETLS